MNFCIAKKNIGKKRSWSAAFGNSDRNAAFRTDFAVLAASAARSRKGISSMECRWVAAFSSLADTHSEASSSVSSGM